MDLLRTFGTYANSAVALAFIAALAGVRFLTKSPEFKRDLRGSQFLFAGFVLIDLLRKLLPADWGKFSEAAALVGLVLFAFAVVRGAAATWFHLHRSRTGAETPKILRDLVNAALLVLALLIILQSTLQLNLSAILTSSAVLSLVIGLAAQETLGSLFAGLSLQSERLFREGEWIRVGAHTGKVTEIAWRTTKIVTLTGELVTVPNSNLVKEAIYNLSRTGAMQRKVMIGIPYDLPPNAFKDLAGEILACNPLVLPEPKPLVRAVEFAPTTVSYELVFWVARYEDVFNVEDDIRSQLWYRLRRSRIEIPVPNTHVRMLPAQEQSARRPEIDVPGWLGRVDFLAGVPVPLREALAERAAVERFGRGETVIRQGDPSPGAFYVVVEGEVAVRVRAQNAVEEEVARLGPGEFFGEMAVLTGEPRTASIVTARDTTLIAIARSAFGELFQRDPSTAEGLADVLAQRRAGLSEALASAEAQQGPSTSRPRLLLAKLKQIFHQLT